MTTSAHLMTEDDLLRLPRGHQRHELVRGELRTMAPSGDEHGGIGANITIPLGAYIKANRLGRIYVAETGFTIARHPDTVRAPDVAFVSEARLPPGGYFRRFFAGPPDLAVEVVSPGDTVFEVDEKVQDWLAAGTRLVWIVNPKRRTVTVHMPARGPLVLTEDQQLTGEDVVSGFSMPVRDIFA